MRGINTSVLSIMEEIRAGKRGVISEGLPAGSQADDAVVSPQTGSKPAMGASGGGAAGGMAGIKPNLPMKAAVNQSAKAQAQVAASAVAQGQAQQAAADPMVMDANAAKVAAAQPQGPKESPQDAEKEAQVAKATFDNNDEDNDGVADFRPDEQGEQQQDQPYVQQKPPQQPGQGRPFGEQAVDFVVGLTEAENGKLATLVAPHYKEAPGDLVLAQDALRAVGEAVAEGLLTHNAGLKALTARFDEPMQRVMVEFVGIAAGTEALFEEKGTVSEGLGKKLATGALASLLAAGGLKAGQEMVTEPGMKRQGGAQTEQPTRRSSISTTIQGQDGVDIARLVGQLRPRRPSLGGADADRQKAGSDLRMAMARVQRGRWDADEATQFIEGRYRMTAKTKKTLAQMFQGGVNESEQPSPGASNPDLSDDHNEDDDKAAAKKRAAKLADMGGYDKGAPSRMGTDTCDSDTGERHREVHDGVLTSEAHDELLDDIFD